VTEDEGLAVAERLLAVETGHVCDALEHVGVRTPALTDRFRPLTTATRFAGRAVTLVLARSRTGQESRRLSELLDDAVSPGTVVVIDAHADTTSTVFGDRAAYVAQRNGASGAVLNGGVRDIDGLNELGFPVHALGRSLPASEAKLQGLAVNERVVLDGVLIDPGDWLVGDSSGICVIPADLMPRVLELAEERQAIDDESFEHLRAGLTMRESHRHFEDDDLEAIRGLE
jgi:regulator of RNase E activity RraA